MSKATTAVTRTAIIFVLAATAAGQALGADAATIERGNQAFQYWCATCHGAGVGIFGPGTLPGTHALAFKYKNAVPAVLESRTDLTPILIKTVVRQGVVAMPFFRRTEVSDADLDAIAAYLTRNNK